MKLGDMEYGLLSPAPHCHPVRNLFATSAKDRSFQTASLKLGNMEYGWLSPAPPLSSSKELVGH